MLGCEDEEPQVRWVFALQAVEYARLLHTSESWGCSPCLHADAPVSPHSEHVHCIGWQGVRPGMCRQLTNHSHLLPLQGFQQALIACRVDVAYESAACSCGSHRLSQRATFQPSARRLQRTHMPSLWKVRYCSEGHWRLRHEAARREAVAPCMLPEQVALPPLQGWAYFENDVLLKSSLGAGNGGP